VKSQLCVTICYSIFNADTVRLVAVRDLKWNLDEASVVHSTAISTSALCMLTPLQAAAIMGACFPHLLDIHYLYGLGLLPWPADSDPLAVEDFCTVEELLGRQPPSS